MTSAPPARPMKPGVILMPPEQPVLAKRLGIAALVLTAVGVLWISAVVVALPRRDPIPSPAPRVVIALGAGARDDATLTPTSARRLETGILYARRHNAGIVTTRAFGAGGEGSDAQKRVIEAAGLADRWTSLPNHIANTRDEALAMHLVISDSQPIAVVTSPLHSRRACATFERVGYRVTCIPAAQDEWWRLPYVAAYESAAFVKYKRRGWW